MELGTNHIVKKQRFRSACPNAQSRLCLHCSHTQNLDVDKDSSLRAKGSKSISLLTHVRKEQSGLSTPGL